uniref:Probable purine permease n=1 Tax=Kalanchoe fedtschenkoi TaxID=63787 RepID=A0A7N0UNP4_KALFE
MAELRLQQGQPQGQEDLSPAMKRFLLILNCILLTIGNCGGPLVMRLYFIHGGKRVWFSSWLETGGCPVILIPLAALYLHRQRQRRSIVRESSERELLETNKFFNMKLPLLVGSAAIGLITGVDDYLYAYGVARLPVSTSSLIIASQLAFTALFAFLLVKQKFTSYSINAIVLLVVGSAVLGINTNSDRPLGVSKSAYYAGFFMTVAAAALYGFLLPAIELMYKKGRQVLTYGLVMEVQLVMCFFATLFCTVGMVVNKDFQAIPREAREYGLGEVNYYLVVVWSAIVWQCFFLGAIGVIFCASSLFSGVVISALLPFTEILAVIIFKEKFQAEKGVALVLSLWGFVSYFYGEIKLSRKMDKKETRNSEGTDLELTQIVA